MKRILIPTDFSEVADNAARYGLRLAQEMGMDVILINVFPISFPLADASLPVIPVDVMREDALTAIDLERRKYKAEFPDLRIDICVEGGTIVEEVSQYAHKHPEIGLIVMGVTGGGTIKKAVMGSNALGVVKQCKTSVLIVPKAATFTIPKQIVLALALGDNANQYSTGSILPFATHFSSAIDILTVVGSGQKITTEMAAEGLRVHKFFDSVDNTIHIVESEKVADAITEYARHKKVNWIAIRPGKYHFLENLLHHSISKDVVFSSEIPIFSIHS